MSEECHEICFIAPSESLAQRAKKIIRQRELSIPVYTAVLEDAVTLAKDMIQQGTWLFISRGVTRELLEHTTQTTVVKVPVLASDYIPVFEKIQHIQGLIAFFASEPISDELQTICYLLNISMRQYQFSDTTSCRACVQQAVKDGAVWGVGGVVSAQYAQEAGLP